MKRIDMTGRVFERLKVKEFDRIENKRTYWKCECECGKIVSVDGNKLRSGRTKSCGCYNADRIKKQRKFNEYKIADGYVEVKLNDENYMFCDIEDWEQKMIDTGIIHHGALIHDDKVADALEMFCKFMDIEAVRGK